MEAKPVLALDIGFEFVDLVLDRGGTLATAKYPVGENLPHRAIINAIDRFSAETNFSVHDLGAIRVASTGALNALFARQGSRVALVTTEGFGDTLFLGRQNRRDLYQPITRLATPAFLVDPDDIHELSGRLDAKGNEIAPLVPEDISRLAAKLSENRVEAVAICLLHAHVKADHENQVAKELARRNLHLPVVLSHQVDPNPREFERTVSTCLEAWLRPKQAASMVDLANTLAVNGFAGALEFCDGSGRLLSVEASCRLVSAHLLSGPASAARHAADLARTVGVSTAIALDIGSTTTDLALIRDGAPVSTRYAEIAEVPLRQIATDIESHALGGQARAMPDGRGGLVVKVAPDIEFPTLAECLVWLELLPLERNEGIAERLDRLARETGCANRDDAARAAIAAAEQAIARAVLRYAVSRNIDPARTTLIPQGGLGALLIPGIADRLGSSDILVPAESALAGAMGLLSLVRTEVTRLRVNASLEQLAQAGLADCLAVLRGQLPPMSEPRREHLDIEMAPTALMHAFDVHLEVPTNDPEQIASAFAKQFEARFNLKTNAAGHIFAMTLTRTAPRTDRHWQVLDSAAPVPEILSRLTGTWRHAAAPGSVRLTRMQA